MLPPAVQQGTQSYSASEAETDSSNTPPGLPCRGPSVSPIGYPTWSGSSPWGYQYQQYMHSHQYQAWMSQFPCQPQQPMQPLPQQMQPQQLQQRHRNPHQHQHQPYQYEPYQQEQLQQQQQHHHHNQQEQEQDGYGAPAPRPAMACSGLLRPIVKGKQPEEVILPVQLVLRDGKRIDASSEFRYAAGTYLMVDLPGGEKELGKVPKWGEGDEDSRDGGSLVHRRVTVMHEVPVQQADEIMARHNNAVKRALKFVTDRLSGKAPCDVSAVRLNFERSRLTIVLATDTDADTLYKNEHCRGVLRDAPFAGFMGSDDFLGGPSPTKVSYEIIPPP